MRWALLAFVVACYQPSPEAGARCSTAGLCPSPLVCVADVCAAPGTSAPDAATDAPPGRDATGVTTDARPDAALAGPLLLLHMDDDPSDGATDSAGSHLAACTACPTLVAGEIDSGYGFDGNDVIQVTPTADFDRTGPFTLATWFEIDSAPMMNGQYAILIAKGVQASNSSYGLSLGGTPVVASYYQYDNQGVGSAEVTLSVWHHVAMTYDGTTVRGYLDGVLDVAHAGSDVMINDNTPLSIGQLDGKNGLVGSMDELAYYARALSAAEIVALAKQ